MWVPEERRLRGCYLPKPPMPPPWIAQVARPHAPPGVSTERPMQIELTDR